MAVATRKGIATAEQIVQSFDPDSISVHEQLRNDPVFFCEKICGWTPHRKQREFLRLPIENDMKVMMPWGRGLGKSQCVIARTAWKLFASRGYKAYVFAPSGDQSKEIWGGICKVYESSPYLNQFTTYKIKGNELTVGDKSWGSKCELVRVGLLGDLGRSRHTSGNGVLIFDEASHFLYLPEVYGTLSCMTGGGGATVLLSSPGDVGSPMHKMYLSWKQLEKTIDRYRVIECRWDDTDHISQEWVDDHKRHHELMGTMWAFNREVLGQWCSPSNVWFPHKDIARCIDPDIVRGNRGDTYVWAADPGGWGRSAFVIIIAKFNQVSGDLQVVDLRSFKFENHRYSISAKLWEGSEKVEDYAQLIEICEDLRRKYPPQWFGVDPNTEKTFKEQLERLQFPVSAITVGGYSAKLTFMEDLKRCIAERRITWSDPRITRQLETYAPRLGANGNWEFPSTQSDIVMCCGMLYRFLGEREVVPFAVSTATRKIW